MKVEWSVYPMYTRADDLCQTNGHFSLNLREAALPEIDRLLALRPGDSVGWVGCGDARELLSFAKRYPDVTFEGFDVNECALFVARRVVASLGLQNVSLRHCDFTATETVRRYTHVYSTALSGPRLYAQLRRACTRRLCMLERMWSEKKNGHAVASVKISGSGEQRELWAKSPSSSNLLGDQPPPFPL